MSTPTIQNTTTATSTPLPTAQTVDFTPLSAEQLAEVAADIDRQEDAGDLRISRLPCGLWLAELDRRAKDAAA